jgi:copper chaperone
LNSPRRARLRARARDELSRATARRVALAFATRARVCCRGLVASFESSRQRPTVTLARMTLTEVTLSVDFACEGCATAVRRIAERIDGVRAVEIDVEAKRCVVRGDGLDAEDVLARVRKCGRTTTLLM